MSDAALLNEIRYLREEVAGLRILFLDAIVHLDRVQKVLLEFGQATKCRHPMIMIDKCAVCGAYLGPQP